MNFTTDPFQIPEDQQTPLVKWLLEIIRDNKQLIEIQAQKIEELKTKVEVLDNELKKLKKLPPKPDIKKSTLNCKWDVQEPALTIRIILNRIRK